jgi:hypothetical protein
VVSFPGLHLLSGRTEQENITLKVHLKMCSVSFTASSFSTFCLFLLLLVVPDDVAHLTVVSGSRTRYGGKPSACGLTKQAADLLARRAVRVGHGLEGLEVTLTFEAAHKTRELGLTTLLEFIRYRRITRNTAVIVTDSYSLLMALETGPNTVQEGTLRRLLSLILQLTERRVRLPFQFVFGHCNSPQ